MPSRSLFLRSASRGSIGKMGPPGSSGKKGFFREFFGSEALRGFDPWDRLLWANILEHYPFGYFWLNMAAAGIAYSAYHAQYHFGFVDKYKTTWLDLRVIPHAEPYVIGGITVFLTYFMMSQFIGIGVIVLYRLSRKLRGKPLGPP